MGNNTNNKKTVMRFSLIVLMIITFYSCNQLKVSMNNSVFYEIDRTLHEINGKCDVEYIENHGDKYYYYIETTLSNLSDDSILIDLSSIKFKIGDNSI
ncbi:MAG: hypothetical protein PF590_08470, partial [Candidatus Delongbacteria bacterium]|nr:hypothetical protein [Candidatus Delongbacteria bacterium]